MHNAIKYGEEKGCSFVELKQRSLERNNIELNNKEVRELSITNLETYAARVLYKGSLGLSFSNSNNYKKLIDNAIKIAKVYSKNLKLKNLPPLKKEIKTKTKINPNEISLEEKKNKLLSLSKKTKKINMLKLLYQDAVSDYKILNSEGSNINLKDSRTGFISWAFSKDGNKIENYPEFIRQHKGYELMEEAEETTKKSMKIAEQLLNAKYANGGIFPVVIDQKLAGVFAHEAVGHACEADIVLNNASALGDTQGKKIGSEIVNISDDSTIKDWGWTPIDDEAVQGKKTKLIENGILKNYMHSRETASIMNTEPSGNGRAQTLSKRVIPRMTCTIIEQGKDKFDDMISSINQGFYLKMSRGGEVDPKTGEFIFNAMYGHKIENGELKHIVKKVSLMGNILNILPKISMIGNDIKYGQGFCGKSGQWIPVSEGSPHIKINSAIVGGKE